MAPHRITHSLSLVSLLLLACRRPATSIALAATAVAAAPSDIPAQGTTGTDRRAGVAVIDFTISALRDAADWAPLGRGIPQILMTEIATNPDLRMVERARLQAVLDELKLQASDVVDPETASRVGKLVGASYVITGGAMIDPRNQIRIDIHAVKVETSVAEYNESLLGKSEDVIDVIARIGQKASKTFDPTPQDAPRGRVGARPTKEGLRLAMLLGNAVDLQDRRDFDGARSVVRQALAIAPEDPSAKAMMLSLERGK